MKRKRLTEGKSRLGTCKVRVKDKILNRMGIKKLSRMQGQRFLNCDQRKLWAMKKIIMIQRMNKCKEKEIERKIEIRNLVRVQG